MNEMVTVDDGQPRERRAPLMAGGRPQPIVPQSMDDAYRLGKAICLAGMAPKGMDSPEKCMIAIMRGMEVGLTPMQALDKIAIVNGRPTIWGDGALGLVRGSGLCEYVKEWIEGEGDAMVAFCEAKRRGEADPVRRSFSVKEAKEAGLWGKAGPWQQFKRRMLAMRARAFCLRDLFADVLGGLYLKEELDSDDTERQNSPAATQRRAPSASASVPAIEHQPPASVSAVEERHPEPIAELPQQATKQPRRAPSAGPAPQQQPKPVEPAQRQPQAAHYDPEKVRSRFIEACDQAKTTDDLNDSWNAIVDPIHDEAFPTDKDEWARIFKEKWATLTGGGEP